jgi:hypothetical protein
MQALGGTVIRGLTVTLTMLAAGPSGCVLVTGSTDGYVLADTGTAAATCGGDATCPALSLGCSSTADCLADGGVEACCLVPTSASGVIAACSAQPCPPLGAQLCATTAECAGSLECVPQQCMFGAAAIAIRACGNVLTCSAQ